MTVLDAEVLDLLQEEPELLAIADAVRSTQRGRRGLTHPAYPLMAAVAVAAVALVSLLAPWRGGGAPIVARALSALGNGPVVHLIVRVSNPVARVAERPMVNERQWEIWFDRKHRLLHAIERRNGKVVADFLETPDVTIRARNVTPRTTKPSLDPGLRDFATRYRADLASGRLRVDGRGTIRGHRVVWLRSERFRVAVDARTYLPLEAVRLIAGRRVGAPAQILGAETLPLGHGNFRAPRRAITVPTQ